MKMDEMNLIPKRKSIGSYMTLYIVTTWTTLQRTKRDAIAQFKCVPFAFIGITRHAFFLLA